MRIEPVMIDDKTHQLEYECGCVNYVHQSGAHVSLTKCESHRREKEHVDSMGEEYYDRLEMAPDHEYVRQLEDALRLTSLNSLPGGRAIELGCGRSPYVDYLRSRGYTYVGIDSRPAAISWMRRRHKIAGVETVTCDLTSYKNVGRFNLVLAAHVLEHLDDAVEGLNCMHRLLSRGGQLLLIVPNDDDPVNPDHRWFFTEDTLRGCLVSAGFMIVDIVTKRVIEKEAFIYVHARKP